MARKKTTAARGLFKEQISKALFKSKDIRDLMFDGEDVNGLNPQQLAVKFKEHVKSHLFIDDTIQEAKTFIFYDVVFPRIESNIKICKVIMYLVCHRSDLDNYTKEGYYGNRADILTQMIENALINDEEVVNSFGIGRLTLESIAPYNSSRFYGCVLTFDVPNFR